MTIKNFPISPAAPAEEIIDSIAANLPASIARATSSTLCDYIKDIAAEDAVFSARCASHWAFYLYPELREVTAGAIPIKRMA